MSFEGGTYTIVVDKDRNIVSVTLNGKPMVDKDAQIRAVEEQATGPPAPFDPIGIDNSSRCICLGEITPPPPEGACVWKWGKLF